MFYFLNISLVFSTSLVNYKTTTHDTYTSNASAIYTCELFDWDKSNRMVNSSRHEQDSCTFYDIASSHFFLLKQKRQLQPTCFMKSPQYMAAFGSKHVLLNAKIQRTTYSLIALRKLYSSKLGEKSINTKKPAYQLDTL